MFINSSETFLSKKRAAQAIELSHLNKRRVEREAFSALMASFSSSAGTLKFVARSALDLRVLNLDPSCLLEFGFTTLILFAFFRLVFMSSVSESVS